MNVRAKIQSKLSNTLTMKCMKNEETSMHITFLNQVSLLVIYSLSVS